MVKGLMVLGFLHVIGLSIGEHPFCNKYKHTRDTARNLLEVVPSGAMTSTCSENFRNTLLHIVSVAV